MVTTRARHSANMIMAHNDGDEHNTGNCDGSIKKNDGVHNDGNEGSVGNDVDEVNDGDICVNYFVSKKKFNYSTELSFTTEFQ